MHSMDDTVARCYAVRVAERPRCYLEVEVEWAEVEWAEVEVEVEASQTPPFNCFGHLPACEYLSSETIK